MQDTTAEASRPIDGLDVYRIQGATNTYVLVDGTEAVLFDCGLGINPRRLERMGIEHVEAVYLTSHDRTGCAGLYELENTPIFAPAGADPLLRAAEEIWSRDEGLRYHMVDFEPDRLLPCRSVAVGGVVTGGDSFSWRGWEIDVLPTPGFSPHDVSYLLRKNGRVVCICGRLLYRGGRVRDLDLLQRGREDEVCGYHGYMEGLDTLRASVRRVAAYADMLLPGRGEPEPDPQAAADHFETTAREFMSEYARSSSLNFYFPGYLKDFREGSRTGFRSPTAPLPEYITYTPETTSFIIKSAGGAAFVADCNFESVVERLKALRSGGTIRGVDFCWLSHYHHDHVSSVNSLVEAFNCPVYADPSFAPILRNPEAYHLTCLSREALDVRSVPHRTRIRWHEFEISFYHFPGQTLYHGGLLLEGRGRRVFFCGDSFSPTGLDDYCTWNRNFLESGRGYFRCLDLLEELQPDLILNQHQGEGIVFTAESYAQLKTSLKKRRDILRRLVYGTTIDAACDPLHVRCNPYGAQVPAGGRVRIRVYFTGHGRTTVEGAARPLLPDGWEAFKNSGPVQVPPSSGLDDEDPHVEVVIGVPPKLEGRWAIPFSIHLDGRPQGLLCHMLVDVMNDR